MNEDLRRAAIEAGVDDLLFSATETPSKPSNAEKSGRQSRPKLALVPGVNAPAPHMNPTQGPAPGLRPSQEPNTRALRTPTAQQALLNERGIDWICEQVLEGRSYRALCRELGVSLQGLLRWLVKDSDRTARANEARRLSARAFEDMAEEVLAQAADFLSLARARELAAHYRWVARVRWPREYHERHLVITNSSDGLQELAAYIQQNSTPLPIAETVEPDPTVKH